MVLRDVEPSQPGSSRLTEVPAEYMDLREANRDHITVQNAVPGESVGASTSIHTLPESFERSRDHKKKSLVSVLSAKLSRDCNETSREAWDDCRSYKDPQK